MGCIVYTCLNLGLNYSNTSYGEDNFNRNLFREKISYFGFQIIFKRLHKENYHMGNRCTNSGVGMYS